MEPRREELLRLNPKAINHEDGTVTVDGDVAKKRAARHVTMNDTLRAWLAICPPYESDKVVCAGFAKKFAALRKKAGVLTDWPKNGLRHSFGSYHLATFGNAVKTAEQMGNDQDIVHKHWQRMLAKMD